MSAGTTAIVGVDYAPESNSLSIWSRVEIGPNRAPEARFDRCPKGHVECGWFRNGGRFIEPARRFSLNPGSRGGGTFSGNHTNEPRFRELRLKRRGTYVVR